MNDVVLNIPSSADEPHFDPAAVFMTETSETIAWRGSRHDSTASRSAYEYVPQFQGRSVPDVAGGADIFLGEGRKQAVFDGVFGPASELES